MAKIEEKKEGKQGMIQSKERQFDQKRLGSQKNLHRKQFQLPFTANILLFNILCKILLKRFGTLYFCRTHNSSGRP